MFLWPLRRTIASMEGGEKDIPYAYDLYSKILEHATVNGVALGALIDSEGYSIWDPWLHSSFLDDCAIFSIHKTYKSVQVQYEHDTARGTGSLSVTGLLLFLFSLVSFLWLSIRRPVAMILSVDKENEKKHTADARIEHVYTALDASNVTYVELFHTLLGARAFLRIFKRKRFALYLEGIDWAFFFARSIRRLTSNKKRVIAVAGLDSFSEDEKKFASQLVQKYVSMNALVRFRTKWLTTMLRVLRIKVILGIDDARHYHELARAASMCSIPFTVFQHGHFTPYHVGWLRDVRLVGTRSFPQSIVVWNEYWKKELIRLGGVWGSDSIIVEGSAKNYQALSLSFDPTSNTVVVPYETEAPQSIVRDALRSLLDAKFSVIFKIRSDVSRASQVRFLNGLEREVIIAESISTPVCAVVGTYSTYLYDAIFSKVPVILLKTRLAYSDGLVRNGLAEVADSSELVDVVMRSIHVSEEERNRRSAMIAPKGVATEYIVDILSRARSSESPI